MCLIKHFFPTPPGLRPLSEALQGVLRLLTLYYYIFSFRPSKEDVYQSEGILKSGRIRAWWSEMPGCLDQAALATWSHLLVLLSRCRLPRAHSSRVPLIATGTYTDFILDRRTQLVTLIAWPQLDCLVTLDMVPSNVAVAGPQGALPSKFLVGQSPTGWRPRPFPFVGVGAALCFCTLGGPFELGSSWAIWASNLGASSSNKRFEVKKGLPSVISNRLSFKISSGPILVHRRTTGRRDTQVSEVFWHSLASVLFRTWLAVATWPPPGRVEAVVVNTQNWGSLLGHLGSEGDVRHHSADFSVTWTLKLSL